MFESNLYVYEILLYVFSSFTSLLKGLGKNDNQIREKEETGKKITDHIQTWQRREMIEKGRWID